MKDVTKRCRKRGLQAPSRATVYKLMSRLPARTYRVGDLPAVVQKSLYNLRPESEVPGHQLAFCCFNYGDLEAVSFAAGLPWLSLYLAARMRGYTTKSRGLLEAVLRARGIQDARA
jgi:hypothetical protein